MGGPLAPHGTMGRGRGLDPRAPGPLHVPPALAFGKMPGRATTGASGSKDAKPQLAAAAALQKLSPFLLLIFVLQELFEFPRVLQVGGAVRDGVVHAQPRPPANLNTHTYTHTGIKHPPGVFISRNSSLNASHCGSAADDDTENTDDSAAISASESRLEGFETPPLPALPVETLTPSGISITAGVMSGVGEWRQRGPKKAAAAARYECIYSPRVSETCTNAGLLPGVCRACYHGRRREESADGDYGLPRSRSAKLATIC